MHCNLSDSTGVVQGWASTEAPTKGSILSREYVSGFFPQSSRFWRNMISFGPRMCPNRAAPAEISRNQLLFCQAEPSGLETCQFFLPCPKTCLVGVDPNGFWILISFDKTIIFLKYVCFAVVQKLRSCFSFIGALLGSMAPLSEF